MAIIKCKMCGGDLVLTEGSTVAECEYCGTMQTVPAADDEKKLIQFERAERLRKQCEFDKAAGIYENIVADFRQEAEAYWGLVLCKFGIEYVDDPATGKKIPTCHRSSFDSIMEDTDFEQALENADVVARKVYRDEAKTIEEIRKGIIAVSSAEEPYDIFICYKETAEDGQRTLDSVLAQDLYDILTDKGYRVFFARITLEDKLGQEYEPYIFAALNSAKIMLAIGTDYEYYNAVWVKNEWSRFLKLMAQDKEKHLIPCYKGIDAYDMPKEFNKLQAQDLGKVGATQDLLRGIEKLLPKQKNTTVIQERVVVGGSGDNKITSLLDRGNMALEDGDWDKADSFFEDVLNNDSKNAQAYLGKTLATERCRTLDSLVRKQKDACQNAQSQRLYIQEDKAHVDEAVQQYSIPNYVNSDEIRKMYKFDLSYPSTVEMRKQQRKDAENWWKNHKWLSRAEKFAVGELEQILKQAYNDLFSALDARLTRAKQEEDTARTKQAERYTEALAQADQRAQKAYEEGAATRETEYARWCRVADMDTNVEKLRQAAEALCKFHGYKDSEKKCTQCQERIRDITASQQAAEAAKKEKQRAEAEARRKAEARKKKLTIASLVSAGVVAVAFIVLLFTFIIPNNKYNEAAQLKASGSYKEAFELFNNISFKDSKDQAYACATALATDGNYNAAIEAFTKLGHYKDSLQQIENIQYTIVEKYLSEEKYDLAFDILTKLGDYKKIQTIHYGLAEKYLSEGDLAHAAFAFAAAKDYSDAAQKSKELWAQITTRETISGGYLSMACIKTDGTVRISGKGDEAYWSDIIAVSKGTEHTVGLRSDGTVVANGSTSHGCCNVNDWTDIVAISTGYAYTVGLKSDGTVIATGYNDKGQCNVSHLTDIIAISASNRHVVGLKADGTVLAAGSNEKGQSNVQSWTDIVAISAGSEHTVGLKADGTVVATGYNKYGQCDVAGWTDIVAICAGNYHTVGLKANGTLVAVGTNSEGQCNVSAWTDIVTLAASGSQTAGLRADGTVIAIGDKYFDCFDEVHEWTNIKIPNHALKQKQEEN